MHSPSPRARYSCEFSRSSSATASRVCRGVGLIDLHTSRYQAEIDPPVLSPFDFEGLPQSNSMVVRHYHPGVPFVLHVSNQADLAALDRQVPSGGPLHATPGIHLQRGTHTATGLTGPLVAAPAGQLLRASIRARDDLASRIGHALRLTELADDPASSRRRKASGWTCGSVR